MPTDPTSAELKWSDSTSTAQSFPNALIGGVDKPQFPAFLVYKDPAGDWQWSTLDTLIGTTNARLSSIITALGSLSVTASGTVAVSSSALPTGAASSTLQSSGNASLVSILAALGSPLAVSGPLTDAQLRASAVLVSAASLPLPTGAATSALQQTDALTNTQLRASAVPVSAAQLPTALRSNRLDVADAATDMEALADQSGANGVLTFTFTSAVQLVWVRSVGGISRAIIGSQTPTAALGAYCAADEPAPLTVNGAVVNVYAPSGATVSVWGMRYS